jgi:plasmanylethanolamine desaturase
MTALSIIILKILLIIFGADFLTGVFHFWMDVYGRADMPFLGKHVVEVNMIHHKNPRKMTSNSYFGLTWTSWVTALLMLVLSVWFWGFHWEVVAMLIYGSNANLIHKWTHQTDKENGRLVSFFQATGIIQSKRHHGWHHKAPFDTNYCILTDWLNPILHKLKFWEFVVWSFKKVGIEPVTGTNIRNFL